MFRGTPCRDLLARKGFSRVLEPPQIFERQHAPNLTVRSKFPLDFTTNSWLDTPSSFGRHDKSTDLHRLS